MEVKKIRFTVPQFAYEILARDIESFGSNKNKICNLIFDKYRRRAPEKNVRSAHNKVIQFNLNAKNNSDYEEYTLDRGIDNESEFFRTIVMVYASLPKYRRQLIIYDDLYRRLKRAIDGRQLVKIKYKNDFVDVEPYLIANSKEEACNYLFCYSLKHSRFLNYKFQHIQELSVTRNTFTPRETEYVDRVREDFDAFLSVGKTVIARLSPEGLKQFNRAAHLRPKVLKQEEDLFTFECSEPRAKIYFPKFLDAVEIISPPKLRKWFAERFRMASEKYADTK